MVYSIDQSLRPVMVDVRTRPEPFLGRSILTPQPSKHRATAKRTGNLFPVGRSATGAGSTPSIPQDRPRYVAPTANMAPNAAQQDDEATPSYSGKGKGRATSPKAAQPSSTTTTTTLEEGEILSQEAYDAKPILTSDVHPDSQQLAMEAARRIQEEVDRIESQRDREDRDFSLTAPEGESQTQEYLEFNETPRRRSRRRADDNDDDDAKMPPALQTVGPTPLATRPKPAQQPSVQQRQQGPSKPRREPLGHQKPPGQPQQQQSTVDELRAKVRALETSARAPLGPQSVPRPQQRQSTVDGLRARLLVPEISAREQQQPQMHRLSLQGLSMQAQQQDRVRELLQQQQSVPQKRKATTESPSEPPQKSPKATNKTPLNQPDAMASVSEQPFNLPSPTDYRTISERIVADARWKAYLARAVPGVHQKYGNSAPTRPQEAQQAGDQPAVPDMHEQHDPSTTTPTQETQQAKNRRTHERHNNKRFELLKPHSQAQRRNALKTILKTWSITEEQLKTLPFAPRQWQQGHLVMNPLDWNGKLLDAVAVLASETKTKFTRGCEIARLTFETLGPDTRAKQLNAEIVSKAVSALRIARDGRPDPRQRASGNRQGAAGGPSTDNASATLPSESGDAHSNVASADSRTVSDHSSANTSSSPNQVASKPSLIVKLPMPQQAPPAPRPSPPAAAAHSAPATPPIKTEQVVPIMVRDVPAHDDGHSSSSDERLNLESTRKILMHQLAIVQEQIALDERKKKERERKAKRKTQLGSSRDEPVVL
jgi:hypothetical protein